MNWTAAQLMENYIEDGHYLNKKQLEATDKAIKDTWKERLKDSENRRHLFGNVVAKWVPKPIYEWDEEGLMEHVFDYLDPKYIVPMLKPRRKVIKRDMDLQEVLAPYLRTPEYYVKPNFNKAGKEKLTVETPAFEEFDDYNLAETFKQNRQTLKEKEEAYKSFMKQLLACEELKEKRKAPNAYGSLSLIEKPAEYKTFQMMKEDEEDLLKTAFSIDPSMLEKWMIYGVFNKKDIEAFRTLKNVRLDFIVMLDEDEEKAMQQFRNKHNRWIEERIS